VGSNREEQQITVLKTKGANSKRIRPFVPILSVLCYFT